MLLSGGLVVSLTPPLVERVDLRVDRDEIVERGARLRRRSGETVRDLSGTVVTPGMVCAHTHLYSSLARGMPPPRRRPKSFREILDRVWWKLDAALDEESIYYSALVGAIDAVRRGSTTIVDHHASPNAIDGSLDLIAAALCDVGLRGVLCYEVTDRNGRAGREAGVAENDRFLAVSAGNRLVRGLVGAHASFTLSDRALAACAEVARGRHVGVHIHVAEDRCDVAHAKRYHHATPIGRLDRAGLLDERAVLAHGVHLDARDASLVRMRGAWLVHNPRSNMNNAVGRAPLERFGRRSALGTDGFPADMLLEAQIGALGQQERGGACPIMVQLLAGGHALASEIFGRPVGPLDRGAAADLVVWNYHPPTPLTAETGAAHLVFGLVAAAPRHVMVGGRWVLDEGAICGVDVSAVMAKTARIGPSLWERARG